MSVTEIGSRGEEFERTPPHDVAAEQCVLGGMLLSKDAISDVIEVIRPSDHYRPAHQIVHEAILDLYARGEPADAITVGNELARRNELGKIGGGPYLHTLIASVPTAANAGYYARIVRERAILRRLVEAGTRIVQFGYAGDGDADELVDRAQAEVYAVTDRRISEDYHSLSEIMPGALDEIEAIGSHGGAITGVPTGFADLDALTNGLHAGQMIVIAARPAIGKSSLALDFARAATIKNQLPTVVFSLEMGRNEITMRLLSAESRVPLSTMRTGQMSDDDWARLARRMSEVADAPLFIDDSPNMSLMEIRAKCRRLKQRHDLKMVIIDYLQLMSSPKRVESRQQEVSEMSRSLKLLAKELEVPVVALSQLNRGPEQRTDKRPMLSDLRESGCVTSDTTLLRADTGAPVSFAELLRDGWEGVSVWSLDEQHKLVAAPLTNVFESGTKEVYRVRLASGREVKASANHPFLTFGGWTRLDQLAVGDRVGIARRVPEPIGVGLGWSVDQLGRLARGVGDRLPTELYSASDEEIRVFLRQLWTTDGSDRSSRLDCRVYYAATSREVADGLTVLLARLGIVALVRQAGEPGGPAVYHVIVAARDLASALDEANAPSDMDESDVYWDQVMAIELLGPQPVYDATVKKTHNFVANGINLHNSIEQDADVVILLHREDAYERESPRAGEADLIVAKHRNGPTATVTVAFQGHYSRFVDMAPG